MNVNLVNVDMITAKEIHRAGLNHLPKYGVDKELAKHIQSDATRLLEDNLGG